MILVLSTGYSMGCATAMLLNLIMPVEEPDNNPLPIAPAAAATTSSVGGDAPVKDIDIEMPGISGGGAEESGKTIPTKAVSAPPV